MAFVTFKCSKKLKKQLKNESLMRNTSNSELIRQALKVYLRKTRQSKKKLSVYSLSQDFVEPLMDQKIYL